MFCSIFSIRKNLQKWVAAPLLLYLQTLFFFFCCVLCVLFLCFYDDHCKHLLCNSLVLISFFINKDQDEMQLLNRQHIDRCELLTCWQIYESLRGCLHIDISQIYIWELLEMYCCWVVKMLENLIVSDR